MAEVVEPAPPAASGRWAKPIEPEPEDLPQAEIVYPAETYAQPGPLAGDLFSQGGAYGDPFGGGGSYPPMEPTHPPASPAGRKKRSRTSGDASSMGFTQWVAYLVLFLLLPLAAIFTVFSAIQFRRVGSTVRRPQQESAGTAPSFAQPGPAPSGLAITLWNATKKSQSDEFAIEYRLDQGPVHPASRYFWVVNAPQGKIEFEIPTLAWKTRGKHAGKTPIGNLTPPFTAHIEEQVGTARVRVSNEVQVQVQVGG